MGGLSVLGFWVFWFWNWMLLRTKGTFSLNCLTFVDFLSFSKCLAVAYFLGNLSEAIELLIKKACRLVDEKNAKMLGHLCLINDNSEMNNNQNSRQLIFLILLIQAVIFLFQVNSLFLSFCQTIKTHPSKQMPAQTQQ